MANEMYNVQLIDVHNNSTWQEVAASLSDAPSVAAAAALGGGFDAATANVYPSGVGSSLRAPLHTQSWEDGFMRTVKYPEWFGGQVAS